MFPILNVWFGGSEAAYAIGDVLFGAINPSGKLTHDFPEECGQIPLYYAHKNTGRPLHEGKWFEKFRSNYLDVDNEPFYPFGYGLLIHYFQLWRYYVGPYFNAYDGSLTAKVILTNGKQGWCGSSAVVYP